MIDAFLQSVGPQYERYERERELGLRAQAGSEQRDAEAAAGAEAAPPKRLPPLSSVPQVFFAHDFDLGDAYTFDVVTERYKKQLTAVGLETGADGGSTSSAYDVVLNQMLQEKLSYYSDVIEQHLVHEIGARSSTFFDALGTLQRLRQETTACLELLDTIGTALDQVDERTVQRGFAAVAAQAERRRLEQQTALLDRAREFLEQRDLAVLLVQHGEFDDAIALVARMRAALDGGDAELARLSTLRRLLPQLAELEAHVADAARGDLLTLAQRTLCDPACAAPLQLAMATRTVRCDELLPAADAPWVPEGRAAGGDAVARVWALLLRCGSEREALRAYREQLGAVLARGAHGALAADAALAWAAVAPLCALAPQDEAAQDAAAVGERLRVADAPAYATALAALLRALLFYTRLAHAQCRAFGAAIDAAHGAHHAEGAAALQEAAAAATEAAQRAAWWAVQPRLARLTELPLDAFTVVFALLWRFVQLEDAEVQRPVVGVRGAVLAQAKAYLGTFHRTHIERAMKAVEEEVWSAAPVPPAMRTQAALLMRMGEEDVEAYVIPPVLHAAPAEPEAPTEETPPPRVLRVGEQRFYVVHASVCVVEMLGDYMRLLVNLPMFATEALGWVVEFLKQFNSRTCQVVLGAGAMRSAGLKNITARHLALASQTLALMIALLRPLRRAIERHLTGAQTVLLAEFDKLERDYREHRNEIHAKLVAIMSDRVQVHARSLGHTDWSAPRTPQPVPALSELARETGTLSRVMAQYLEPAVVNSIISTVFGEIDSRLAAAIRRTEVRTPEAHARLVRDKEFLDQKLTELGSTPWKGDAIAEAVTGKQPPEPTSARSSTDQPQSPMGYRPRFSFGKRPPATQSPQLEALDAFERPSRQAKEGEARESRGDKEPRGDKEHRGEPAKPDEKVEKPPKTEPAPQAEASKGPSKEAPSAPPSAPPSVPPKDADTAQPEDGAKGAQETAKPPSQPEQASQPEQPTKRDEPAEQRTAPSAEQRTAPPAEQQTAPAPQPETPPAKPSLSLETKPVETPAGGADKAATGAQALQTPAADEPLLRSLPATPSEMPDMITGTPPKAGQTQATASAPETAPERAPENETTPGKEIAPEKTPEDAPEKSSEKTPAPAPATESAQAHEAATPIPRTPSGATQAPKDTAPPSEAAVTSPPKGPEAVTSPSKAPESATSPKAAETLTSPTASGAPTSPGAAEGASPQKGAEGTPRKGRALLQQRLAELAKRRGKRTPQKSEAPAADASPDAKSMAGEKPPSDKPPSEEAKASAEKPEKAPVEGSNAMAEEPNAPAEQSRTPAEKPKAPEPAEEPKAPASNSAKTLAGEPEPATETAPNTQAKSDVAVSAATSGDPTAGSQSENTRAEKEAADASQAPVGEAAPAETRTDEAKTEEPLGDQSKEAQPSGEEPTEAQPTEAESTAEAGKAAKAEPATDPAESSTAPTDSQAE